MCAQHDCVSVFALDLAWPNKREQRRAQAQFQQGSDVLPTEKTLKCLDSSVNAGGTVVGTGQGSRSLSLLTLQPHKFNMQCELKKTPIEKA